MRNLVVALPRTHASSLNDKTLITKMPRMDQDSFASLSVLEWKEADSSQNGLQRAASACAVLRSSDRKPYDEEVFAPIEFAEDEVFDMVASWEQCSFPRADGSSDAAEVTGGAESEASRRDKFDPLRRMPDPAPPKAFTRRSTVRTVVRRSVSSTSATDQQQSKEA